MSCTDGKGYPCPRPVTGYLVDPEGRHYHSCAPCARACIEEYAAKLGVTWTWEDTKP
jgi:hypothetical protein